MNATPAVGFQRITQGSCQSITRSDKNGNGDSKVDLNHINAKDGFKGEYYGKTAKLSCSLRDLSNGSLRLNNVSFNKITLPEDVKVDDNAIVTIYMDRGEKEGTDSVRFKLRGGGCRFDATFSDLNLNQKKAITHDISFTKSENGRDYSRYNSTGEGCNSDTYIEKQNIKKQKEKPRANADAVLDIAPAKLKKPAENETPAGNSKDDKVAVAEADKIDVKALEEYFAKPDIKKYLEKCLQEKPKKGEESSILKYLNEFRAIVENEEEKGEREEGKEVGGTSTSNERKLKLGQLLSLTYEIAEQEEDNILKDITEKLTDQLSEFKDLDDTNALKEATQNIKNLSNNTRYKLLERFDTLRLHGLSLKMDDGKTDLSKEQYQLKIDTQFEKRVDEVLGTWKE